MGGGLDGSLGKGEGAPGLEGGRGGVFGRCGGPLQKKYHARRVVDTRGRGPLGGGRGVVETPKGKIRKNFFKEEMG